MSTVTKMTEKLEEILPVIDGWLSSIPPHERPLLAAIEFVRNFVLEVEQAGERIVPNVDESTDFVAQPWFAKIFRPISEWYRDRYGAALDSPIDDKLHGVVVISGAPFALEVPATVFRPDKPGETDWVSWPDKILDNEASLNWLVGAPNLEKFDEIRRSEVEANVLEIAIALRRIRSRLLGVPMSDDVMKGLIGGILPSLEQAAKYVLRRNRESLQKSYWELQMACEHALKAWQRNKTGNFTETHDLFLLWDDIPDAHAALPREVLEIVPRGKELMNLRYSQGERHDLMEWFGCYRSVLRIAGDTLKPMIHLNLGDAQFLIGRLPWLQRT